jgi:hypothetical protein
MKDVRKLAFPSAFWRCWGMGLHLKQPISKWIPNGYEHVSFSPNSTPLHGTFYVMISVTFERQGYQNEYQMDMA